jgi:hypothetical protein
MLEDLYVNRRWGMEQIGEFLGVDKCCVRKALANDCKVVIRRKGRPTFKEIKLSSTVELSKYSLSTLTIKRKAIKH